MKINTSLNSCFSASFNKLRILTVLFVIYNAVCMIFGIILALSISVPSFYSANVLAGSICAFLKASNVLSVAVALGIVILLFSKYINYCSDNAVRALPAKDKDFFTADFLSGFFVFVLPAAISLLVQSSVDMAVNGTIDNVVGVSGQMLLNYIFSYCLAVLCFCICGQVFEGVILFVIFSFIPSIAESFINFAKSSVLGLFPVDEYSNKLQIKTAYSVVYGSVTGDNKSLSIFQIIVVTAVMLFLSFIVAAAARLLFIRLRKRNSSASRLKKTFSTIAVVLLSFYCGFLVLYFKRSGITLFNAIMSVPTMLATAFVVFYLFNTVTQKSIRISPRIFKPYIIDAVLLIAIGAAYFSGGFGLAQSVPLPSEVASVAINYTDSEYKSQVETELAARFTDTKLLATFDIEVQFPIIYEDYRSIYDVTKYHSSLIAEYGEHELLETYFQRDEHFDTDEDNPRTEITYTLKNGRQVKRFYNYNGSVQTLKSLAKLKLYDNSISTAESRATKYLNQDITKDKHVVMVAPIASDKVFTSLEVSDEQMHGLISAIQKDENSLNDAGILNCTDGDICTISIIPADGKEDYFSNMLKMTGESFLLVVKGCYKNTAEYLRGIGGYAEASKGFTAESVKQIIAGNNFSGIQVSWYSEGAFRYSYDKMYDFSYLACERYYNKAAMLEEEYGYIDGSESNTEAVNFLLSKMKLYCNTDNGGKYVILNRNISSTAADYSDYSFEQAPGKQVFYVSAEDWTTFLNMSK